MKKFIQITLIVVLVLVSFQAMAGGSTISAGELGSHATSSISARALAPVADVYAAGCLVRIKGVVCVQPLVGWNG
jgi:hypothetical protein